MSLEASLVGRTILVTGGAHRLGGEISRHLGQCGARMVVHYHGSAARAHELVRELPVGSLALSADLSRADGARTLFAACAASEAHPDAVVHNAASFLRRPFLETTSEEWDQVMALNLRALFLLAQELVRSRGESGGDLVAIGDSGGLELWPGYFAHGVAKAAVLPLVRALAKAVAPRFRVNGVIPGPVLPPEATPPEELSRIAERTLLKRIGSPGHIAQAVEFLLTCDYATGSWIEVTGGSQLWRGQLPDTAGLKEKL
ncbi:MAG: SDR family oxidoreductase [Acidobacteriota bacterium]|nr:SDR family oxidoreductase [Acidobacteriota bacterium]